MSVLDGLNLTPFEWSMSEVTSRSPMEFSLSLYCSGEIDSGLFSQAVSMSLKGQPMLQANASVGSTHRESCWRPAADDVPVIHWMNNSESAGGGYPADFQPIDLEHEIGFRLYGWRHEVDGQPQIELKFVFHHACCDGKGGLGLIGQTLVNYVCLLEGKPTTDSGFDNQLLLRRNAPAVSTGNIAKRIWRTLVLRPKRAAKMLLSRPRLLTKVPEQTHELFSKPPQLCTTSLDLETTKRLGDFAKSHGTTTNIVLARELFHTLNEDLRSANEIDDANDKRNLRVLIPFSLRDENHLRMPAANCVSMAYLEAKHELLDQDSQENPVLLQDLTRQSDFIRRWNLHYSWIESIEQFAKFWPLIKLFRRQKKNDKDSRSLERPIATTVMTNLGRVFHGHSIECDGATGKVNCGPLKVDTVHIALPLKPTITISFGVNFYRNRLTLDVGYLPSVVSEERALRLLDIWRRRLEASVACGA